MKNNCHLELAAFAEMNNELRLERYFKKSKINLLESCIVTIAPSQQINRGRFFVIFFFFFLFQLTVAQPNFNREYQLSPSDVSKAVFETSPGSYLVGGLTYDTVGMKGASYNRLTFVGLNATGDVQWRKDYGSKNFEYLDGWQGGNAFCQKGTHYYATMPVRDSSNYVIGSLIEFNNVGDTLWQKTYRDTGQDVIPLGMCLSIDGGILLTGFFQNWIIPSRHTLVIKTDINGKELWRREIAKLAPDVNTGSSIIQDPVSRNIIIAGYQYVYKGTAEVSTSNILVLDSLGDKKYQTSFNNAEASGMGDFTRLSDGNFLVSGMWVDHTDQADNTYSQAQITKFNANGYQLWTCRMPEVAPYNACTYSFEQVNGDIWVIGKSDSDLANHFPTLFCLDGSGNVKWKKYLGRFQGNESINDLKKTSDKGFIFADCFVYTQSSPYKIVKMDSMFCDTLPSYCRAVVGISNIVANPNWLIDIFPNPAKQKFSLAVQGAGEKTFKVLIQDLSGRTIKTFEASGGDTQVLDCSDLSAGTYFVQIKNGERFIEIKKLSLTD